jgi:uncharacterized membrane protein HdeD (DUF308 family)
MEIQPMIDEPQTPAQPTNDELHPLTKEWFWFLLLGVVMIVLGMTAISMAPITTLVAAKVFGIILMAAGIVQTVSSFWSPKWSGLFLHLMLGLLYLVVGVMVVDSPVEVAGAFALLMSAFFIVSGIFRIVACLQLRFPNWGWSLLSGFVSLLLGVVIWSNWPCSTILVGVFVGVEILFNGWAWLMFGLMLKALKKAEEAA